MLRLFGVSAFVAVLVLNGFLLNLHLAAELHEVLPAAAVPATTLPANHAGSHSHAHQDRDAEHDQAPSHEPHSLQDHQADLFALRKVTGPEFQMALPEDAWFSPEAVPQPSTVTGEVTGISPPVDLAAYAIRAPPSSFPS